MYHFSLNVADVFAFKDKRISRRCRQNLSFNLTRQLSDFESFHLPFNRESHNGQNGGVGHSFSGQHLSITDGFAKDPRILTPKPVQLKWHSWKWEGKNGEVSWEALCRTQKPHHRINYGDPQDDFSDINAMFSYTIRKSRGPLRLNHNLHLLIVLILAC